MAVYRSTPGASISPSQARLAFHLHNEVSGIICSEIFVNGGNEKKMSYWCNVLNYKNKIIIIHGVKRALYSWLSKIFIQIRKMIQPKSWNKITCQTWRWEGTEAGTAPYQLQSLGPWSQGIISFGMGKRRYV